ncbi:MAG: endonuclease/exonuclease/phosphatase family protein [Rhodobacteraceae bacterium]|nr:endonuclease/exonuclease/phosphatase family protein [Paracoccaceae bacterium]
MTREKISFCTFNLLNLQKPRRKIYPGAKPLLRAEYDSKLRWTAQMLQAAQADVYGFQELWAADALVDAFKKAGLAKDYEFVARDAPGIGRPQVALAVRKGMLQPGADWHEDFPESLVLRKRRTIDQVSVSINGFSRPVLVAEIKPPGPKSAPVLKVLVAHLKSKRPVMLDREEYANPAIRDHADAIGSTLASIRRTAEAAALRALLNGSMAGNQTPHVVLGDLNNGSASVSTGVITGDPRYKIVESGRQVSGRRADRGLYSVETLMQYRSQRHVGYTHIYENKLETLDHILVSEEFYDHSPNRKWSFVETVLWNDHLNDHFVRNRDNPPKLWPSDHAVVKATFEWNELKVDSS